MRVHEYRYSFFPFGYFAGRKTTTGRTGAQDSRLARLVRKAYRAVSHTVFILGPVNIAIINKKGRTAERAVYIAIVWPASN